MKGHAVTVTSRNERGRPASRPLPDISTDAAKQSVAYAHILPRAAGEASEAETIAPAYAMLLADWIEAETRYRLQFARDVATEAEARGYERGLAEGYLLAVADLKAFQHGLVRDAQLERRRWHLCCRRCRLNGHRDGCPDCEDRTRETFSQPLPGEPSSPAEILAAARASWAAGKAAAA
jgi:hypothetical protein